MRILYVPKIEGTSVLPFVIDAYTSLRAGGNIEACDAPATGDEEAFYILNRSKEIVAVLSFSKSTEREFTVNMGFVAASCRRRGYYAALWARLVEEAETRGIQRIMGYHKPANKKILAVNERLGRTIRYVCSEYNV